MTQQYRALARRFRPQRFADVVGQEAIVTTLKNALRGGRVGHAYLFCGTRGTGKTTLARIFAKAINCAHRGEDQEPCNTCGSCLEIAAGHSMDVLEIDGASHRGIDDIRSLNETVGYAAAGGATKIYIIDEVHMLTKEAFNALLKTLEEPPEKVKFFFATTEPHKVLPTILSRCQRYSLGRIPLQKIADKLTSIVEELGRAAEPEALLRIAKAAEGGLRDAESMLDQILAFSEGVITTAQVSEALGLLPSERLFELDEAGPLGDLTAAFRLAGDLFDQGKDPAYFLDTLADHYRTLLALKIGLSDAATDRNRFEATAKNYTTDQCLYILDQIGETSQMLKTSPSKQVTLEALLLRILRSHTRISADLLVQRLIELEKRLAFTPEQKPVAPPSPPKDPVPFSKPRSLHQDTVMRFAAVELEGSVIQKTTE